MIVAVRWLAVVVVVSVALVPAPREGSPAAPTPAPVGDAPGGEPLLFVGDSLCVGARDHGGGLIGALRGAGWDPEFLCSTGEGLEWGLGEVAELERVAATVVVALGTNPGPREPGFAERIRDVRSRLVARGAERILWVDFADRRDRYTAKNEVLHALARCEGDGIVRWSVLAIPHPEWFRSDGIHYEEEGMRRWSRRIANETTRLRVRPSRELGAAIDLVTARRSC